MVKFRFPKKYRISVQFRFTHRYRNLVKFRFPQKYRISVQFRFTHRYRNLAQFRFTPRYRNLVQFRLSTSGSPLGVGNPFVFWHWCLRLAAARLALENYVGSAC